MGFREGDEVRSQDRIERGPLDPRGFANVAANTIGEIDRERISWDGSPEYDVRFDGGIAGEDYVERVRPGQLKRSHFPVPSARRGGGGGSGVDFSEPQVLLLLLVVAGFLVWSLPTAVGAFAWTARYPFEDDQGMSSVTYGTIYWTTGLAPFVVVLGCALLIRFRRSRNGLRRAIRGFTAAACLIAAPLYWFHVAPRLAADIRDDRPEIRVWSSAHVKVATWTVVRARPRPNSVGLARLTRGARLAVDCRTSGAKMREHPVFGTDTSSIWLRTRKPRGWVSKVDVSGTRRVDWCS